MWLSEIHTACADQIRNHVRRNDITVSPWPDANITADTKIEVWPGGGTYVGYWGTFGENGTADGFLRIRIEIKGSDAETSGQLICDLLSVGSAESSSVVDALMIDKTLGGKVTSIVPRTAEWLVDEETHSHVAWIECEFVQRKSGARA